MLVEAGKKTEAIALAEGEDPAYPKAYAFLGIARQLATGTLFFQTSVRTKGWLF
jgi:hypothetical protein